MHDDILYQVALTQVPKIGCVHAKLLTDHFGSARAIFEAREAALEKLEGIGRIRARSLKTFTDFTNAEKELAFLEKYHVKTFFLTDPGYPQRLLHCYDPPTLLFYRGEADLNTSKIVSVIGTREHTPYGKYLTEKLVEELRAYEVLVVSGMAFGIDAIAHKAALKNGLPTVGVLGHGLDSIYPAEHLSLARDILRQNGGLLTEFPSHTKPDRHHFPTRNRIVAGISDASIVVETELRGGSMITAELANGYHKDVFAFPGKITDPKSAGCHFLIRNHKAMLLTGAAELAGIMGWEEKLPVKVKPQKDLFAALSADEKRLVDLLKEAESLHIDEINLRSGLSGSVVATALLNLELEQIVSSLPGKLYRLA